MKKRKYFQVAPEILSHTIKDMAWHLRMLIRFINRLSAVQVQKLVTRVYYALFVPLIIVSTTLAVLILNHSYLQMLLEAPFGVVICFFVFAALTAVLLIFLPGWLSQATRKISEVVKKANDLKQIVEVNGGNEVRISDSDNFVGEIRNSLVHCQKQILKIEIEAIAQKSRITNNALSPEGRELAAVRHKLASFELHHYFVLSNKILEMAREFFGNRVDGSKGTKQFSDSAKAQITTDQALKNGEVG